MSKKNIILVFLALCSLQLQAETPSHVDAGRFRIGTGFTFGKSIVTGKVGNESFTINPNSYHASIGPSVHGEYLLLNWLSLGAKYRALFELGDAVFHDIDGVVKFIFPQEDPARSEYYVGIPVGYSMMTDSSDTVKTAKGFNLGAAFGGHYFLNDYFGFNFEVGYNFRRLRTELAKDQGTHKAQEKVSFNFHEFAGNVGIALRF